MHENIFDSVHATALAARVFSDLFLQLNEKMCEDNCTPCQQMFNATMEEAFKCVEEVASTEPVAAELFKCVSNPVAAIHAVATVIAMSSEDVTDLRSFVLFLEKQDTGTAAFRKMVTAVAKLEEQFS